MKIVSFEATVYLCFIAYFRISFMMSLVIPLTTQHSNVLQIMEASCSVQLCARDHVFIDQLNYFLIVTYAKKIHC